MTLYFSTLNILGMKASHIKFISSVLFYLIATENIFKTLKTLSSIWFPLISAYRSKVTFA